MSDTVIRVENLGKKYIIGHQQQGRSRYTALRDVLADGAKSVGRRILNPFAQQPPSPAKEEFWALKDVSFEIKQGFYPIIIACPLGKKRDAQCSILLTQYRSSLIQTFQCYS